MTASSQTQVAQPEPHLRRPWLIVAALAWTELSSWGVLYYSFGVLLSPMQQELGWSQATLTSGFALALVVAGLAAVPVGWLLDRWGARRLMTGGSLLAPLLVLGWARIQTQTQFWLVWAGLGLAMALVLYEPAFAVVAQWFPQRRDRALTVLTVGGGLASVVYVPLTTWLLARYGWRHTLDLLALILIVTTLLPHALLLRAPSREQPESDPGMVVPKLGQTTRPLRTVIHSASFWWLASAFFLSTLSSVAITVQLISFVLEHGHRPAQAALIGSVLGGAQIPGRVLLAPLGVRLGRHRLAAVLFGLQAVGLALALGGSFQGLIMFAAVFGMASGALTPLRATLIADQYGVRDYGAISGLFALILTGARSLAPLMVGFVLTAQGHSTPLLLLGMGCTLAASLLILPVGRTVLADHQA